MNSLKDAIHFVYCAESTVFLIGSKTEKGQTILSNRITPKENIVVSQRTLNPYQKMEPQKNSESISLADSTSKMKRFIHSDTAFERLITVILAIGWLVIGFSAVSVLLAALSYPLELLLQKPLSVSLYEGIALSVVGVYGVIAVCFAKICQLLLRIERNLRKPETSPETD